MKRKLFSLLRIALLVMIAIGWYHAFQLLTRYHYSCCPDLYDFEVGYPLLLGVLFLLLLPMLWGKMLITRRAGYRLHRMHWFFLEVTEPDKLRVRLSKRFGYSCMMLPPRTDGTSPYVPYLLSGGIYMVGVTLALAVLTLLFWRQPLSRVLLPVFGGACLACFAPLLPRARGDALAQSVALHRSRDLRRIWECLLHMSVGLEQGHKLMDMPDAWFLPAPAALAEHPLVRLHTFNRASRLIDQERELEGYELLRYFFDLEPKPETYQLIAGAILNGAVCEAMNDLPPMCLSQLDHIALKAPLPPQWNRGRLTAQYARALFLHHDEAEAAAILPDLEKAIKQEGKGEKTLHRLQEKAGILPQEEEA